MNLLEIITRAADAEQIRLQPLPQHAVAEQEEHLRRHYALLLASALGAQTTVTETQSRLLLLLLEAMQLGDVRAALFEEARALESDTLLEAARLIRESGFGEHLLVDAMVLLRLDGPLTDDVARLIGELATFLGVDAAQLQMRAGHAAEILGLVETTASYLQVYWPGRLPRTLTREALQQGLQGGLWFLNEDLSISTAWQASDAVLIFAQGVTLNTEMHAGECSLTRCTMQNAALNFVGQGALTLQGCHWEGVYEAPRIALSLTGIGLSATDCDFSTRNATAISARGGTMFVVEECRFLECGADAGCMAGAIELRQQRRTIKTSRFERCKGHAAGAVLVDNLYGISSCEFIECRSSGVIDQSSVAIFTQEYAKGNPGVTECIFRECSLFIGSAYDGVGQKFIANTQFENASLYYHEKYSRNTITVNCVFNGGDVYESRLVLEEMA